MDLSIRMLNLSRPIVFLVAIVYYLVKTEGSLPRMAVLTVSAAFFMASSAVLVGWIPAPRYWINRLIWSELTLACALNLFGSLYYTSGPMPITFYPILITILFQLERRLWPAAVGSLVAGWFLTSLPCWLTHGGIRGFLEFGIYGVMMLFAGSIGSLIRNLDEEKARSEALLRQINDSRGALERAHRQLQDSAAQQGQLAVLEERQRLARDIHDGVAHALTALVVQIQAGRRLLETSPEKARQSLARCEEAAREALQETRWAVRALHPSGLEAQTETEALARLGRDFGIATGIGVEVTADLSARQLQPDPARLEQLYRIFQEALTNAHRHGQAKQVKGFLTVRGEPGHEALHLLITNDGLPPGSLDPGLGLKSMVERARSLGGSVRFEPRPVGLAIEVAVPVRREALS